MQDLNDKITGGTLEAAEWNEVPSELQNIIESQGLVLSSGDLNQLGKALSGYISNGHFYTDSGIANAYVLSVVGSRQNPPSLVDGLQVSFLAANANSSASTVNVSGLGVKSIKLRGGNDPATNDINGRVELSYDLSNNWFELKNPKVTNKTITKATIAAAKADDDLVDFVGGYVKIINNDHSREINSNYLIVAGLGVGVDGEIWNSDTASLFHLVLETTELDAYQFNCAGDGVTDDDTAVNTFITFVGNGHGVFRNGRYLVETAFFNQAGGTFTFENAGIVGGASGATDAIVELVTNDVLIIGTLFINGAWNTNYTAALKWHSLTAGTPAQFNIIDALKINNSLIGILFGQIDGDAVVTAPQSENVIGVYNTRAVERAIYFNQPSGVLTIRGGNFGVSKGEWDTESPATFDYTQSRVMEKYQGALILMGAQINSTESGLGLGFENKGGSLDIVGGNWEIAPTALELSGGSVSVSGIASDVSSQGTIPFCELVNGTSGNFTLSNFKWAKASGAAASDQGLLQVNSTTDWDVNLTDVYCDNQNRNSLIKSTYQNNTWLTNITMSNVRTRAPAGDIDVSTSPYNLLDTVPTDATAIDNLWFQNGTGTTTTNASVPTVAGRVYDHSIKVDASASSADVTNLDRTSAGTAIATGMRVVNGKKYMCEGWVRREVAGTGTVKLFALTYTAAGAAIGALNISTEAEFVGEAWTYIRGIVSAQSNAAFMGIGISVANDIGYFVDLKVNRID